MSNKTFNMFTDKVDCTVPLPHRDLRVGLSPESHCSGSSPSLSLDSDCSNPNLSDRETNGSPDINMLDCCLIDGSTMDDSYNITIPQANSLYDGSTNLNRTFIATPDGVSVHFWNENLSNHERSLEKYHTFSKNTEDVSDSTVMSPDSAGKESQLSSCETSRRGSSENDSCSLSSGEMVIRSNSFCFEDQSVLVVSSLDESSISEVAGCSTLPSHTYLLSTTLPDVCENSTQREVINGDTGHSSLGRTFTQAELPTKEKDISRAISPISMPAEDEGGCFMTFVCEASPSDCEIEARLSGAEAEILVFPGQLTLGHGKAVFSTFSAVKGIDKDIHTSTPVQTTGNKIPNLPSFSESPCTENAVTPVKPVKQQQTSGTPKQPLVSGLHSASKFKKREIKKFPKSDFSGVKSKVVTRNVHQMSVAGCASQHQPSQAKKNNHPTDSHGGAATRVSPAKVRSRTTVVSNTAKPAPDALRQGNSEAANFGASVLQLTGHFTRDGQGTASPPCHLSSDNTHALALKCSNACSKSENAACGQLANTDAEHAGNKTFCFSDLEKSSTKIEVRSGSTLGQDNSRALKSRPRCSSESLSSASLPTREKRTALRFSTSLTISKVDNLLGKTKPGSLNCNSKNKNALQTESTNRPAENSKRGVKKISPVMESRKSTTAIASLDDGKSRFRGGPSPRQMRVAPLSQSPAASPRPTTLSARQRQGTLIRDECKTPRAVETALLKVKSSTGTQKIQTPGGPFIGTSSSASLKPQLNRCQTPQTTTRSSLMGLLPTPASRLPRKTPGPFKGLAEPGVHTEYSEVSGGAAQKQTPFRAAVLKAKPITSPGNKARAAFATGLKPAAPTSKGPPNLTVCPLKRNASARLCLPSSGPVDKSKPKTNYRPHQPQQHAPQPNKSNGPPDVVPANVTEGVTKDQSTDQLRELLAAGDRRFEAVAIVLQQTLSEHEEATKHCRELSQELVNLRGELVCSVLSSERLEKEKDELRATLEDALHKLQEQHQKDLAELEQKLQTVYQAEWDKVHLTYQEEADKCKALMQQQIGELKANHEAIQLDLQKSHVEELQCVKQRYETSLEELSKVHKQELQCLGQTLKEAEAALSEKIEELTEENNALIEKLSAEENRRKELTEKCQKDSQTLYLEQELDSLKVVLDIKNKQLHQQEKKLMEVDKLKEKNVKLDESLKRVQQENEDLKARMDRHAAMSRQLSTEQAVLQESLQKESKVNKRLSMENEELLWKLHNGDLSSPRKLSPTSPLPSHSFSLQSPRSSGLFSSPPVSPR
ncbi:microtubule-associated tumor suppressor 1 homolog A isoform X1 [Cheilinus undulatus]|uniref:microtubule-associated tumor suppressor 1 homolog A isoform X1 n=1 Tax=Cheilinus undulatus TaxID=241271 RepID=UPI001BD69B65|nr:microtubule-associated tumor suppressor 1 homolog A isoform X1 [Cheilinus undulatus]XP_041653255.1 microtubule-associated tumor suppressor 1 homolog A isoform X1 [Cheilinus undulatus]XP_041653256.1 microtubule-associated tumor suppressor 1 homolog A isoform X1 [Cheilinus undulatus]XP_041653257.1 microtubule-associated tumor suppressor 1 homolog A isoform X1 [Cheilinus undulatus]XP_041653258.1 microtubule-associated tumor suppressor 1 homolog A isoform X1 [Cheilinus undulatus]